MTLPFSDNKRKWQCFVCGIQFLEYEECKLHILEEHEEGREYIKCPHCLAPIRDLKTHWQAKHGCMPMPKGCQMSVIVWKDFSGKKKKKGPRFKTGKYESTKMKKIMTYRSGYESDVFECLDTLNEVVAFDSEIVKIPYLWKGEQHTYVVDLLVKFNDGSVEMWEIKPQNQTHLEQNKVKWEAAKFYCDHKGWTFQVIKEREIQQLKSKVKNQLKSINN